MNPRVKPLRDGDPKKFQGWALNGLIGEGGQSTIYLAEKNGQLAALKMIRKEFLHNEKAVSRFFTEIKNLEMLKHPNIARVLEVEPSGAFLAIEFVDGPNLEQYLIENGPFKFDEWCNFTHSLAKTIEYCHSKGIIHKDVSPQNIVIGDNGPVLIDFGISYLEKDPRLTAVEETIGTPPFMSPEHFGISTPKEMDSFSLAGTLIFAATGHNPFIGETKSEWRDSIRFDKPDFSGLVEEQVQVLTPLLYKKPEERISLSTFSEILTEITSGAPLSSSAAEEIAKKSKRATNKLIGEQKTVIRRKQNLLKISVVSTIIALLSIGIVAFAIFSIQTDSLQGSLTTEKSSEVSGQFPNPNNQNSIFDGSAQKDNSPVDMEIQANLDLAKKFYGSNELDKALIYAKRAAEAGNAQGMYRVAYILTELDKPDQAITWYQKSANLGYGDAFWNLGSLYEKTGEIGLAINWYEKGAKENNIGSLNALGFYFGEKNNDYQKAIPYYRKSADLGSVMGMANLAFAYQETNKIEDAKKWYIKASDLGSVDASLNLGYLFEMESSWAKAKKYYERASNKKDPLAMYNLAILLGNHFGQGDKGCSLLKESISIKTIEKETLKLVQGAIKDRCEPKVSKSSAGEPSNSNTYLPSDGLLQPLLKYSSSEYSEKISSSSKNYSIFGRAFLSEDEFNWIIPLTNSPRESVPPINRVQFRDSARPYSSWWNMPYELKDGGNVGWQAIVSNLGIQLLHSSGGKVCPEFRFALVQNDLVTATWSKTVEPCSAA